MRGCSLVGVGLTCCYLVLMHAFCMQGIWMSAFWTNHHQSDDSSQEPHAALTSVIGVIANLSFLQIEILPLKILKSDPRSSIRGNWDLPWLVFISLFLFVTSLKVADYLVTFPTCIWPSWFTHAGNWLLKLLCFYLWRYLNAGLNGVTQTAL